MRRFIIRKSEFNIIHNIQDYNVYEVKDDGKLVAAALHISKRDAELFTACGNAKWE